MNLDRLITNMVKIIKHMFTRTVDIANQAEQEIKAEPPNQKSLDSLMMEYLKTTYSIIVKVTNMAEEVVHNGENEIKVPEYYV